LEDIGVETGFGLMFSNFRSPEREADRSINDVRRQCQAKFLTPAKFLTCYCLSVIVLLRKKK